QMVLFCLFFVFVLFFFGFWCFGVLAFLPLLNSATVKSREKNLCRQKHTDLACVHTEQENLEIDALTNKVWFGLFKDAWVWSDGAETSFRYWQRGLSYSGNCVSVESTQQGRWLRADCNQKTTFICHGDRKLYQILHIMSFQCIGLVWML
uniref:C-type lectin domain-containing protein n=1 Tax=Amphilophus citrinellus TaxID=61819 RepID=A0A3Q0RP32_AMPCI